MYSIHAKESFSSKCVYASYASSWSTIINYAKFCKSTCFKMISYTVALFKCYDFSTLTDFCTVFPTVYRNTSFSHKKCDFAKNLSFCCIWSPLLPMSHIFPSPTYNPLFNILCLPAGVRFKLDWRKSFMCVYLIIIVSNHVDF